jgi:AAA domain
MSTTTEDVLDVFDMTDVSENHNGNGRARDSGDSRLPVLRRWTMKELVAEPDEDEWLIREMFITPTYGMIAGEMKTLKTYLTGFIHVGLAAGIPIFGHFGVDHARPVVSYVGEGGRKPYRRRMDRIARSMGLDLNSLPIHPVFEVAPIGSDTFRRTLDRDLAQIQPGLVSLDPFYIYHGTDTKASDLHQEGPLLGSISGPCVEANSCLSVVNHFNQTGSGRSLKRITMAGSGEWADMWILLSHRKAPDVENGHFSLVMELGSRQWGASIYNLDLNLGRFDHGCGTHDGDITWKLEPTSNGGSQSGHEKSGETNCRHRTLDVIGKNPGQLTKSAIADKVGGNHKQFGEVFTRLEKEGRIVCSDTSREEKGIQRTRSLWSLVDMDQADGPGSPKEMII